MSFRNDIGSRKGRSMPSFPPRLADGAAPELGLPAVTVPERAHRGVAVLLWQVLGSSEGIIGSEPPRHLAAGNALWVPIGVAHSLHVNANSIVFPLHLRTRPNDEALRAPAWIAVDGELQLLLLALLQSQSTVIRPRADLERRVMGAIAPRIVPYTALPMPRAMAARAIAEFVRDHPSDARPLAEIVREHHVSARTVERSFLAETGMTLRTWRHRRRLEAAQALLRGSHSPAAAASEVGYESPSAFRRAFTRHIGESPAAYRQRFMTTP